MQPYKLGFKERAVFVPTSQGGGGGGGGEGAQSVERATLGEEVPGSIPAVAPLSLLVGSVSVKCDRLRQNAWSPRPVSYVVGGKIVRRSVSAPVRDRA